VSDWPAEATEREAALLRAVNTQRARGGCCAEHCISSAAQLVLEPKLVLAARRHALDLSESGVLSHESSNGASPFDRMRATAYKSCKLGETLGQGQENPEEVLAAWLASPEHCNAVLDPGFQWVGIASQESADQRRTWVADYGD
jgi:uncharacterized protein YkwD